MRERGWNGEFGVSEVAFRKLDEISVRGRRITREDEIIRTTMEKALNIYG